MPKKGTELLEEFRKLRDGARSSFLRRLNESEFIELVSAVGATEKAAELYLEIESDL